MNTLNWFINSLERFINSPGELSMFDRGSQIKRPIHLLTYTLHIFPPSIAAARLVALRERRRAGAVGRRGGLRLVAGEL